ncbi:MULTISPECIES: hypothetical protein [Rhizobium]|jgi:hypothetical protein|uniref:hypothetical protein n=1 Tax=Rhizobium TaxID=379 RepID=UPI00102FD0CA|nr:MULTISPECIES: hypothetical protein [Rhizobium]TBY60382.1 hypothetical protein E0H46_31460 [Rhizobium leguminosarum bv. viciae]MBY3483302.1 hypothetical protein [Rhizobium laguerreae]NEH83065.1 hypothetical protein [Rhizobium ruizarguesonis]NEJ27013.1 hypothetical protein [Rhizobium ruizarguesonis]TBF82596.1 hypothetical protein ELG86_10860 [Rhizobium leguminosarum]
MWIRLEKDELDLILKSIPEGPLAEKLRKPVDPDTAAFAAAVQTSDDLEVDLDTIISRGDDDGAFVMTWTWVSNERAGLSPSYDDGEEVHKERSF